MLRLPSTRQFLGGPVAAAGRARRRSRAGPGSGPGGRSPGRRRRDSPPPPGRSARRRTWCCCRWSRRGWPARSSAAGSIRRCVASEARFRATCEASPFGIFLAGSPRRVPLRQCGRPTDPRALRGRRSGARVDERAAPRGSRADRVALGDDGRGQRWIHDADPPLRPCGRWRSGSSRFGRCRSAGMLADRNFLGILEDVTGRVAAEKERQELLAARRGGAHRGGDGPQGGGERPGRGGQRSVAHLRRLRRARFLEGRYTYANDRAVAMIGLPAREAPWSGPLVALPATSRGVAFHQAFEQAPCGSNGRWPSRDGATHDSRWFDVRVYPSPTGVIGLLRGRLGSQAPRGGADRRSRLPPPGAGRARRRSPRWSASIPGCGG